MFARKVNRTNFTSNSRHLIVKQFKHEAPNQELLLVSFEELNWEQRIDDPLPRHPGKDPKQRLHDTIKKLNRGQFNPLIRFFGDGTGRGVCWEPRWSVS